MASGTNEKSMATEVMAPGADEPDRGPAPRIDRDQPHGFFTIYKKGQGYWTRLGTAAAAIAIVAGTAYFLYQNLQAVIPWFDQNPNWKLGIIVALTLLCAFFGWRLMNKPENADFLIATDSEMKKVNWTSRRELFGSTKVVIIFMFAIALFLFLNDVLWGYVFYWLTVLKNRPF